MRGEHVAISFCFPASGVLTGCIKSRNKIILFVKNFHMFVDLNMKRTPETGHFRLGRFGRVRMSYNEGQKGSCHEESEEFQSRI